MKILSVLLPLALCGTVQADGEFNFHGFLLTPPECVVSNDRAMDINFSNVRIDDIDGNNFKQTVPYTIDCDTDWRYDTMAITLTLTGTESDFNEAAVKTNINGFAIAVYQDGKPFILGSTIQVDETAKPVLEVVPVKKSGVTLEEGDFEAWATLQVEYQ